MRMMTGRRILAVSSSERLLQAICDVLRPVGYDVSQASSAQDADAWQRVHRADLSIIDIDAVGASALDSLRGLAQPASARGKVLVLVRSTANQRLRALFKESKLTNFLAVPASERIDPVELTVTLAKILSKDIFGFARYLGPQQRAETHVVHDSRQKRVVVDAVHAFASDVGCHARVAETIAASADELITNAVYNAPVDREGKLRFMHYSRDRTVELDPGEEVKVHIAFDGRRLALAAIDTFGSLEKQRVLDYLTKCFAKGEDQVDDKEGGAGLGLYYIFNAMHHFVINIAPGKCTEAIGLVEVTRSFKEHSSRTKSFNVFVQEPD
jgi:CheY-like chemotaxis protein